MTSFPPSPHPFSASSHSYASALISSTPSLSSKHNKKQFPHKKHASSSWADQVDEARAYKNQTGNKKQKLNQIMNWPKAKHNKSNINNKNNNHSSSRPPQLHPRKPNYGYQHKDGEKQQDKVWLLAQRMEEEEKKRREVMMAHIAQSDNNNENNENNNRGEIDILSDSLSNTDSHSCDSYSIVSGDSMSCDTSSCQSIEGEVEGEGKEEEKKRKKKNKNKKRKRKYSLAEEGKKVFVGGITFEDCDPFLSNQNETLSVLRQKKFSQIFYLFGSVNRIQGHWDSGYCFVVYSKRRDAKLAIKCLSMAKVRRKAPTGVLPLPSFYVRWANNPNSSNSTNSVNSSTNSTNSTSISTPASHISPASSSTEMKEQEDEVNEETGEEEKGEMDWVHTLKEEDMLEEDVERLMRELLKLHDNFDNHANSV